MKFTEEDKRMIQGLVGLAFVPFVTFTIGLVFLVLSYLFKYAGLQ